MKQITEPDEYTWIGRVGYGNSSDPDPEIKCSAVLIHQRYALISARCVLTPGLGDATFILFGDWQATRNIRKEDCRPNGNDIKCAPPPQVVNIEELVVHPMFDSKGFDYEIALAKLAENVKFSDFVQPICLPPAYKVEGNHIAQRLEMTGFRGETFNKVEPLADEYRFRTKLVVQTASSEYCSWNWQQAHMTFNYENQLCAMVDVRDSALTSGTLMGIEYEGEKPRNFYVIGIAGITLKTSSKPPVIIHQIMRVLPFRDWILKNMA
ncbi:phenoloxidase-activating factor 3-like isoform X2 [Drosophila kikkawai]